MSRYRTHRVWDPLGENQYLTMNIIIPSVFFANWLYSLQNWCKHGRLSIDKLPLTTIKQRDPTDGLNLGT